MQSQENYHLLSEVTLNSKRNLIFEVHTLKEEDWIHIINLGASVMMTRDNFLPGGGFVRAIVDNNLYLSITRGDEVAIKAIRFFAHLNQSVYLSKMEFEKIEK